MPGGHTSTSVCSAASRSVSTAARPARLGPDPLRDDADPEVAWRTISRSRRVIDELWADLLRLMAVGVEVGGAGVPG